MSAVVDALVAWVERLNRCQQNCCLSQNNITIERDVDTSRNSISNLGFEMPNRQQEDNAVRSQETIFQSAKRLGQCSLQTYGQLDDDDDDDDDNNNNNNNNNNDNNDNDKNNSNNNDDETGES